MKFLNTQEQVIPPMPIDLLVGKKTGLDEQRALAGTQGRKKKEFVALGRKEKHAAGLQGFHWLMQGENQRDQRPFGTSFGFCHKRQ